MQVLGNSYDASWRLDDIISYVYECLHYVPSVAYSTVASSPSSSSPQTENNCTGQNVGGFVSPLMSSNFFVFELILVMYFFW